MPVPPNSPYLSMPLDLLHADPHAGTDRDENKRHRIAYRRSLVLSENDSDAMKNTHTKLLGGNTRGFSAAALKPLDKATDSFQQNLSVLAILCKYRFLPHWILALEHGADRTLTWDLPDFAEIVCRSARAHRVGDEHDDLGEIGTQQQQQYHDEHHGQDLPYDLLLYTG